MQETVYRCDATGDEIREDEQMRMLTVEVCPSGREDRGTIHLKVDAHPFHDPTDISRGYVVYLSNDDEVVMLEEQYRTGSTYYGPDPDDPQMYDLITTLQQDVDLRDRAWTR